VIGSIAAAPVAIALEPAHDVDDLSKYDRYRIYNHIEPTHLAAPLCKPTFVLVPTIPGLTL
jgi:hypothetical protein